MDFLKNYLTVVIFLCIVLNAVMATLGFMGYLGSFDAGCGWLTALFLASNILITRLLENK